MAGLSASAPADWLIADASISRAVGLGAKKEPLARHLPGVPQAHREARTMRGSPWSAERGPCVLSYKGNRHLARALGDQRITLRQRICGLRRWVAAP